MDPSIKYCVQSYYCVRELETCSYAFSVSVFWAVHASVTPCILGVGPTEPFVVYLSLNTNSAGKMKDWSNLTGDWWVERAQELRSLAGPGLWQKTKQNKNIKKAHLAFRTDFGLRKKKWVKTMTSCMVPPSPAFALLTCVIACVITVTHSYSSFSSAGFDTYAMCPPLQNNTE